MAFTNFAARSGGSNLNAGTRTGDTTEPGTSADLTYASGTWVSATGVFTVAAGDPAADGVAVGDFASVYADGASVTTLVGRVTARDSTTITVSTTAKSGTTTDGTSNRTLKIGGAWLGPNGASGFPFNFITSSLTNAAGDLPRVNYKNDATYSITANITGVGADTRHQGYASTYEDMGIATLDGGTSGASYILIGSTVGANAIIADFRLQNNGATGSAVGLFWNSNGGLVIRVVVNSVRGSGFQSNAGTRFVECEAYSCNQSNTASHGGFLSNGSTTFVRCISHDNSGSNSVGFLINSYSSVLLCIADTNGFVGFHLTSALGATLYGCDAYANTSDGIRLTNAANMGVFIENCNLIANGGYGIAGSGSGIKNGIIRNCGFGSGTAANTSGATNALGSINITGSVTYPANETPWTDPADGDFRINHADAKGAGRGIFTQTQTGYGDPNPTVAFPDIGAGQGDSTQTGGGGGLAMPVVGGWIR